MSLSSVGWKNQELADARTNLTRVVKELVPSNVPSRAVPLLISHCCLLETGGIVSKERCVTGSADERKKSYSQIVELPAGIIIKEPGSINLKDGKGLKSLVEGLESWGIERALKRMKAKAKAKRKHQSFRVLQREMKTLKKPEP